jgi:protein gp37
MSDRSPIEWTEATWNPSTGCDRVSPGCDNCYALRMSARLKKMGSPKYQSDGPSVTSGPGFGVAVHSDTLTTPLRWRKPRLVFVNSMSDLFHAKVPIGFIRQVFAVMGGTPRHQYQLLTKRSVRLRRLAGRVEWSNNIWMGVTVESARYTDRIDDLRTVPAAVRFLSLEPLLGPLENLDLTDIHWVIVGGESGPGARPVDAAWVRSIRDQCLRASVPFYFKQWGGTHPKSGGRELDGRTWSQMPAATRKQSMAAHV